MHKEGRTRVEKALGMVSLIAFLLAPGAVPSSVSNAVSASSIPHSNPDVTLTIPNAQTDGFFGPAVAIYGSTVVVGAYNETAGGYSEAGYAYAFNAVTGALIARFTSPKPQADGWFGYSVAVYGSTVAVGAPSETGGKDYSHAGHVYVFDAHTGVLMATLTSPSVQAGGAFGKSVAISGSTLVIGASDETSGGKIMAGNAYVFNAHTDAVMATLKSPEPELLGWFGWSVAVNDNTVIVGALEDDSGGAYVFNASTGALIAALANPEPQNSADFGRSVAIEGSTAVVGAQGEVLYPGNSAGSAYVFNALTGTLKATLRSPIPKSQGEFGESVAINGSVVAVGAPLEFSGRVPCTGSAYVFNASTGALMATLTSPKPQANGLFGYSVAIEGTTVVAGAPWETAAGHALAGNVHVFPAFKVIQPVSAKFVNSYGGSRQTVTVQGCDPFPSSFPGDGSTNDIAMDVSCAFSISAPSGYQFIGGTGTTTCASGTCPSYTASYLPAHRVAATIKVGTGPVALAYDPANLDMCVANMISGTVSEIGTGNRVVVTNKVGSSPKALGYDPANYEMFVSGGTKTWALGYDPVTKEMYEANWSGGKGDTVSAINYANEVMIIIAVGTGPRVLAYDPATNEMYVGNWAAPGTLSAISSGNKVAATIKVGAEPIALAYNPTNREMYVADCGSNTLSVIA